MAGSEKKRRGNLLIQQDLLTNERLMFALDEQRRSGRKHGRIAVECVFVAGEGISLARAKRPRIAFVNLKPIIPKPDDRFFFADRPPAGMAA